MIHFKSEKEEREEEQEEVGRQAGRGADGMCQDCDAPKDR